MISKKENVLYKDGYSDGFNEGYEAYENEMFEGRERLVYFFQQKLLGGLLIFLAAVLFAVSDVGLLAVMLFVPLGLYLIFTKNMVLTNNYWAEHHEEEEY